MGYADPAALAAAEWADFGEDPLGVEAACDAIWALHHEHLSVFIFEAKHGNLRILQAPAGPKRALLDNRENNIAVRAELYRDFLAKAVATEHVDRHFFFALTVGDHSLVHPDLPIFGFQKRRGEPNLLLPDIDFLWFGFYADEAKDQTPLLAKQPRAVFAGSTTGNLLTHAILDADADRRIRSFRYFRHNYLVDYRLPVICQVVEAGVEERLRAMGIGGPRVSWEEQLGYRFLISQDGNGATCSRVFLALGSNSVLLKYHSDSVLFYFRALQPMVHFIPTRSDAETLALVKRHRFDNDLLSDMDAAANDFCDRWLTRPALEAYSAALLRPYPQCIGDAAASAMAARFAATPRLPVQMA